jgi:hypothetical protein
MKLSQKRTCNSCKAESYDSRPYIARCELGFSVTEKNYEGIPLEKCYKPLTNSQYVDAREIVFPRIRSTEGI